MISDTSVYATRNKLRFTTPKGEYNVEQLWEVPLRSNDTYNLNEIAKGINKALKSATEENFVEQPRTAANTALEVKFEVVKFVISAKRDDEEAAKRRAENHQKKEKLLALLDRKQDEKMDGLTITDIRKQLAALED